MLKIFLSVVLICTTAYCQSQISPIFNAFKQGGVDGGGNCASIAVIKATIGTYGIGNVYTYVGKKNDSQTQYLLRSGDTITISDAEISLAITNANFQQKNIDSISIQIKMYADTCFALMCKHLQDMNNTTFDSAIADLNDGYTTQYIDTIIGVKFKQIKSRTISEITYHENMVLYNTYHAVYASKELYDEAWNESGINFISNLKFKRWGWKCGFIFCGVRKVFILE